MKKLCNLAGHLTVILALIFLVFLVLDQFNPLMNFVDNEYSRWMLGLLCLSGLTQTILKWKLSPTPNP